MIALKDEKDTKQALIDMLRKEGHPAYAKLLEFYDVNLTKDPDVVAFTEYDRARVVINRNIYDFQASTLIRHEMLHVRLDHFKRSLEKINLTLADLDFKFDDEPEVIQRIILSKLNDTINRVDDWEISNVGYTEEDKMIARNIVLGARVISGLVTEDSHPGWEDLTGEEMYEKLEPEIKKEIEILRAFLHKLQEENLYDYGEQAKNTGQQSHPGSAQQQGQQGQSGSDSGSAIASGAAGLGGSGGFRRPYRGELSPKEEDDIAAEVQKTLDDIKNDKSGPQNGGKASGNPYGLPQSSHRHESSSGILDIEDISRALNELRDARKSDSGSMQENGLGEADEAINEALDRAIDAVTEALDEIPKNDRMSDEDKNEIYRKILDKVNEIAQRFTDGQKAVEDDVESEPASYDKDTAKKVGDALRRKLRELARKLERIAAESDVKAGNPDFDRSRIDQAIELRMRKIADIMSDAGMLDALGQEADQHTEPERLRRASARARKEASKTEYNSRIYSKEIFLEDLDKLLASQTRREKKSTYRRPPRRGYRGYSQKVILPGKVKDPSFKKPTIVVYYDRSGSWQVPWKTKAGDDAISMINEKYVKKGLVDLQVRYFADWVGDEPDNVGYGNAATQDILDDAVAMKATNVILLTDNNINQPGEYRDPITLPGKVYYIFVESQSPAIVEAMRGKQGTEVYFIPDNKHIDDD